MSNSVKLYVYDLSNGLARQLSQQLTGRQIDGIWHTSVVTFGKEVYYGQGIGIAKPGQTHHGQPLQIIDMGETSIDEDTFNDYVQEMNSIYTADKYHLLDFNCNSFTNDCIGFLTGGSIPAWIKDLPADFLSTPFGAALRPTIDNMYRRPTPGVTPAQPAAQPLASSLLQSVAAQAAGPSAAQTGYLPTPVATPTPKQPAAATVAAPLQVCTNMQHFREILSSHRAVVAFFTSRTCPPCRIIEPVFEDLAANKSSKGVAFVKVDLGGFLGNDIAGVYSVRATPTFLFFLDSNKAYELKGANVPELRSQVDFLIYDAFPPHPHVRLNLPTVRGLSLEPILFTPVPALDTVQAKLASFIDAASAINSTERERIKTAFSSSIIPFIKTRNDPKLKSAAPAAATVKKVCEEWSQATVTLVNHLPPEQLFPLIDLWRVGVVDASVAAWCAGASVSSVAASPVLFLLQRLASASADLPKPTLLTMLRLLSNTFTHGPLARSTLFPTAHSASKPPRDLMTTLLVPALLHTDAGVRTTAASLAFNIAALCQKPRVEAQRAGRRGEEVAGDEQGEGDWEVEMVSAVVEALRTETASEDVAHRLTASLAFFLHLSPFFETQLLPLLEVLQVKDVLKAKLSGGPEGLGEKGVTKREIRTLVQEVADKLCDSV